MIDADAIQIPSTYVDLFENCRNCKLLDRDQVREIIDNTPTIEPKRGEWIPCSERLPSENGDYLVTLENGVVKILGYSTTQRTTYPKGFYHIKDGFSWRQMQNPVVAWMPLPEPYDSADMRGADDE